MIILWNEYFPMNLNDFLVNEIENCESIRKKCLPKAHSFIKIMESKQS